MDRRQFCYTAAASTIAVSIAGCESLESVLRPNPKVVNEYVRAERVGEIERVEGEITQPLAAELHCVVDPNGAEGVIFNFSITFADGRSITRRLPPDPDNAFVAEGKSEMTKSVEFGPDQKVEDWNCSVEGTAVEKRSN